MVLLQDILYKVGIRSVKGNLDVEVKDLQIDSRKVGAGSVFIAIKGVHADGHQFIEAAAEKNPVAIICEVLPEQYKEGIAYVQVENSAAAAGHMAHHFYGQPSEKLKLVGVTGTNGKTTIATLLFKLFTALGYSCGLISTVENMIAGKVLEATHTTPDAVSLNRLLGQMAEEGVTHAFMEVSQVACITKQMGTSHKCYRKIRALALYLVKVLSCFIDPA